MNDHCLLIFGGEAWRIVGMAGLGSIACLSQRTGARRVNLDLSEAGWDTHRGVASGILSQRFEPDTRVLVSIDKLQKSRALCPMRWDTYCTVRNARSAILPGLGIMSTASLQNSAVRHGIVFT